MSDTRTVYRAQLVTDMLGRPISVNPACRHTTHYAEFSQDDSHRMLRTLGTWTIQENRKTGKKRVACSVCGKLYGYVR